MTQYISYDDLVLSTPGLESYWRLDGSSTTYIDLGPHEATLELHGSAQSGKLFDYSEILYFGTPEGATTLPEHIATNASESGEFSIVVFGVLRGSTNAVGDLLRINFSSGHYTRIQIKHNNGEINAVVAGTDYLGAERPIVKDELFMLALTQRDARTELYLNGVLINAYDRGKPDIATIRLFGSKSALYSGLTLGHLSVYSRVLSANELSEHYRRRNFQGKIAGNITIDGAPGSATIRAFRRSDGHIVGQATAGEDGSYVLTVLDNVQVDLLAIPPDGVSARPLAHGPILPKPYEQ